MNQLSAGRTQLELAMEQMVLALNGDDTGAGIDPAAGFPGKGIVTGHNLNEYEPQWAG